MRHVLTLVLGVLQILLKHLKNFHMAPDLIKPIYLNIKIDLISVLFFILLFLFIFYYHFYPLHLYFFVCCLAHCNIYYYFIMVFCLIIFELEYFL